MRHLEAGQPYTLVESAGHPGVDEYRAFTFIIYSLQYFLFPFLTQAVSNQEAF